MRDALLDFRSFAERSLEWKPKRSSKQIPGKIFNTGSGIRAVMFRQCTTLNHSKWLIQAVFGSHGTANWSRNSRAYSGAGGGGGYLHKPKRVGTHNGSFHCDEALGCFMIRLTNKFSDAQIVRTRDSQACIAISIHNIFCSLSCLWTNFWKFL